MHVIYSREADETVEPKVPYKIHWTRRFNVAAINLDVFSFAVSLNRLIRRERFDVVHGNAEESFFFFWICRRYGAVSFFTSHAPFVPATGMFRALFSPVSFLKSVNPHLLRSAARRANKIITFSRFSKSRVLDGLGKRWRDRIDVISAGIDPSWFEVKRTPMDQPELVFWGRMEDEKGVPELLQALQMVARKIPEVKLTLIGEGHRLEEYKRRVRKLGLIPRTVVPGWRSMEAIQKLAGAARLGVFPSRIESFGLSVAEALGAGLPVIATRAGALPEIVEHEVTGTLVPPRNPEALALAILKGLNDMEKVNLMAGRGRERALRNFSWDATARRLIDRYENELQAVENSSSGAESR